MLIRLIRNQSQGSAITGRLVINGRWFCNTLERVGYQIPALCYHVMVTQSPKFKRLLPLVTGVPRTGDKAKGDKAMRQGIRFHRGSKPEHSTGCILVVADNINDNTDNLRGNKLPAAPKENIPCRSRDIDSSGMLSKLSSNNNSSLSSNEPLGKADTTSTKSTQPAQRAPNPPPAHNRLQRKPMPNTKWQK